LKNSDHFSTDLKPSKHIQQFSEYIQRHPLLNSVTEWSKRHSLPGLSGIPIHNLLLFIYRELQKEALVTRANSMAFSFFLAIFPGIIVLFTLLPYTPLYQLVIDVNGVPHTFEDVLRSNISEVMPGEAGDMLFSSIREIATMQRSGLLSFGFFLAIWFASNGMISMMEGMKKNYSTFKKRTFIQSRITAFQLTFLVSMVLVGSVVFVILGDRILDFIFRYIRADFVTRMLIFGFRWIVVILLFYTTFSTIYRYGSSTRRPIPFFNPGAMLASVLSILVSWGFSFYVDNFGNYHALYGSIGALIVLMIWIQTNCFILLIGFELNAGIAVLRDQMTEVKSLA
jgi:membrane protein